MADKPQIRVSEEHWEELNALKKHGDDFDDVIGRLLEIYDEHDYMAFIMGEPDDV